ncbi:actinia tenebrosa protease inhibitors-like, partial [Sceloporus undulatus]|uniref:actinia tenebrosa protease inhibitors-like n=1 Tax=Sceloporus undulatus TaxID=8520 RepID=UPI001C4DC749
SWSALPNASVPSQETSGLPSICKLSYEKGPCQEYQTRYYYKLQTQKCEKFVYGGCRGNENNFRTVEECQKKCQASKSKVTVPTICRLPPKRGDCHAHHTRYYYNQEKGACEEFIYSGCSGNANRFLTAEKCQKKCKSLTGLPVICKLAKDSGTCSEKISRYYYNRESKRCERFIYSGCGGNANHFHSAKECEQICSV